MEGPEMGEMEGRHGFWEVVSDFGGCSAGAACNGFLSPDLTQCLFSLCPHCPIVFCHAGRVDGASGSERRGDCPPRPQTLGLGAQII